MRVEDNYELSDRLSEGYAGRWRYRVTARSVETLYGRVMSRTLFRRRADAAAFCARSEVFGRRRAYALMDAEGLRYGSDFKIDGAA